MRVAATYQQEPRIRLETFPQPALPQGGALIRVSGCGLCGSDLDKLMNRPLPDGTVLGHEVVGRIAALSKSAKGDFYVGQRVVAAHHVPCGSCHYCRNQSPSMCPAFKATNIRPGGFSEVIAVSGAHLQHVVFPIPDLICDVQASAVEPLACVLRGVERSGSFVDGSVAVIGLGFIGLLAAQAYALKGYRVYGVEKQWERLDLALSKGWIQEGAVLEELPGLKKRIADETPVGRVDTVFLTAVNAATIRLALELVRDGGSILLFASQHAASEALIDPNPLYFREVTVTASYSPSLESLRSAATLIFSNQIDVRILTTHILPLSRLDDGVSLYRSGQAIKVFIEMNSLEASSASRTESKAPFEAA
jgi:L-iditol 2-dehydrogenase